MQTVAYYFLQVLLCSALMMGYYLLVLRNKRFHQYNRFYLLAVAVLSWIIPLIKISWSQPVAAASTNMIQFLSAVADNNSQIEAGFDKGFQWSGYTIAAGIYLIIAAVLLAGMLMAFLRVFRLLQVHSCRNVEDVYLILTNAKGTPFSFFRYIFWNQEIDLGSESGKQILQHEITHVRQRHSIDKVFIQAMLIPGWFNPFFWLLKREMDMIHEFIADKKAVNNGDTASLAQMLLTAAYPQQRFAMTNPFFFSPIKRRLKMLTENKNPRFSYLRRAIVLPLLAIVVILFSFRNKEQRAHTVLSVATVMENVIARVSDKAPGETSKPGEDLIPAPVQKITIIADTTPAKAKVVIKNNATGKTDTMVYGDRAHPGLVLRGQQKPPLFVVNGEVREEFQLADIDPDDIDQVNIFKDYKAIEKYGERAKDGVIEIITRSDSSRLQSRRTWQRPTISGSGDAIIIKPVTEARDSANWRKGVEFKSNYKPLYVVNGVRHAANDSVVDPQKIYSVRILKDEDAAARYGEEYRAGVIEIVTKKAGANEPAYSYPPPENPSNATWTVPPGRMMVRGYKLEVAEFPGGQAGWSEYLLRSLDKDIVAKKGGPPGKYTVMVTFTVNETGELSNIKAENDPGYGTKDEAIRVIAKGPKWRPAVHEGKNYTSTVKQAISFYVAEPKAAVNIKANNTDRFAFATIADSAAGTKKYGDNVSFLSVKNIPRKDTEAILK